MYKKELVFGQQWILKLNSVITLRIIKRYQEKLVEAIRLVLNDLALPRPCQPEICV